MGPSRAHYLCEGPSRTAAGDARVGGRSVRLGSTRHGHHPGAATVVLLALGTWTAVATALRPLRSHSRGPRPCASGGFFLFSPLNDDHEVKAFVPAHVPPEDVAHDFSAWQGLTGAQTVIVVATEGGGVRAAYWTAMVLSSLQDRSSDFASHLYAISSVSGGSVGAAIFETLLANVDGELGAGSMQARAREILSADGLSPLAGRALYPDLLQRLVPARFSVFDRGNALEMAWASAASSRVKLNLLETPMSKILDRAPEIATPVLERDVGGNRQAIRSELARSAERRSRRRESLERGGSAPRPGCAQQRPIHVREPGGDASRPTRAHLRAPRRWRLLRKLGSGHGRGRRARPALLPGCRRQGHRHSIRGCQGRDPRRLGDRARCSSSDVDGSPRRAGGARGQVAVCRRAAARRRVSAHRPEEARAATGFALPLGWTLSPASRLAMDEQLLSNRESMDTVQSWLQGSPKDPAEPMAICR